MIKIIPLIVLALASFRLTRFLVIDTMIARTRNKLYSVFVNKAQKENKFFHHVWDKLYELTSCTWCAGFWVSLVLYWAYVWESPFNWNQMDLINIFAIAGIQGFLHAIEPGDE